VIPLDWIGLELSGLDWIVKALYVHVLNLVANSLELGHISDYKEPSL